MTFITNRYFNHGRTTPNTLGDAHVERRIWSGQEALEIAGLDYEVHTHEIGVVAPALEGVKNANRHHVSIRSSDGAIVGVNGTRHTVIQNDALAELGDAIRKMAPDFRYVAGGESTTGETTFLIMESDTTVNFGNHDDGTPDIGMRNLWLVNDFGGNHPLFGLGLMFRPSCMNQLSLAKRKEARLFTVRHTSGKDWAIAAAKQTLVAHFKQRDAMDEQIQRLIEIEMSVGQVQKALLGACPEKAGRSQSMWENRWAMLSKEYRSPWNAHLKGTALGVYMAAQGVDEHGGRSKFGQTDVQRTSRVLTQRFPLASKVLALTA